MIRPRQELLRALSTGATATLELARIGEWEAASATVKRMNSAWKALRPKSSRRWSRPASATA